MELTEASHLSKRLSLPEGNTTGKSAQKSHGHVTSGSTAQHAEQQEQRALGVEDKAGQPVDLTQEVVPGKSAGSQGSQPAVLTDSSRKKRRSFLLQSKSLQKVVDLT